MKQEKKIPMTVLIERLGKRLHYPVTYAHFGVLMHGWGKHRPDEAPEFSTLRYRKRRDGFLWFTAQEVVNLSRYAGYDLTSD